ncbi:MAG TPA: hypothetical protein VFT22_02725 [Kofleriaceae bacterium]|nr:hypothetical protein [Kofleriaceae bacterium]
MRFLWLLAGVGPLWTGCFYVDPVNRRPKISNVELCETGSDPEVCGDVSFPDFHHGDTLQLRVNYRDPDSDGADSSYQWKVSACHDDGADQLTCTPISGLDARSPTPTFVVPRTLESGASTQKLEVDLVLYDGRGASATQHPIYTISEGPTLTLQQSARTYTVGAPIKLFATYGDPDEDPPPSGVQVSWTVIQPPDQQPPFTLTDLAVPPNPQDPAHVTVGKTLVPGGAGLWDVRVIATSSHQLTNEKHVQVTVAPDAPPCLAQWQPAVPPDGVSLPLSDPTLFAVPVVADDLDPYPPLIGEPLFGTATFEWSILPPGATTRQRLVGATGNSIELDPSAFKPGDQVEVRVEVFDRNHAPVACPDGDPVCVTEAVATCNRRQTWRVEVR